MIRVTEDIWGIYDYHWDAMLAIPMGKDGPDCEVPHFERKRELTRKWRELKETRGPCVALIHYRMIAFPVVGVPLEEAMEQLNALVLALDLSRVYMPMPKGQDTGELKMVGDWLVLVEEPEFEIVL